MWQRFKLQLVFLFYCTVKYRQHDRLAPESTRRAEIHQEQRRERCRAEVEHGEKVRHNKSSGKVRSLCNILDESSALIKDQSGTWLNESAQTLRPDMQTKERGPSDTFSEAALPVVRGRTPPQVCEHNISGTPWGIFFKIGTNFLLVPRVSESETG